MSKDKPQTIMLPAFLDGVNTLKDGSMSVRFHTQELTVEQKVAVMNYVNQQGWLAFRENEMQAGDMPDRDADFDDLKSPSQRLRSVLYVLWKENGQDGEFRDYYHRILGRLISHYKSKLPDKNGTYQT